MRASEATTASEVKSDLRFEIGDPNYILIHVLRRAKLLEMGTLNTRRSVPLPVGAVSRNLLPIIVLCIHISYMEWTGASEATVGKSSWIRTGN